MRVVVLGTSNSILRGGYADALRQHPEVSDFLRIGPGGSTSVILPYFGMEVDFAAFDCAVIDTSVNDGAFLGWGLVSEDDIRCNVEWVCSQAVQRGCVPLLLIMPNRTKLDVSDRAAAIYKEMAPDCGALVLDGYGFVERHCARSGTTGQELFMDDLHLRADVAVELVPDLLALCRHTQKRLSPDQPPQTGPVTDYRRIEARALADDIILRRTSLLQVDCVALAAEGRIRVGLEAGERLCGVVYNAAHSSGSLVFEGETRVALNVRSAYFGEHELVVLARQVSPAVAAQAGHVEIALQKSEGQAEIIGLLIKGGTPA